MNKRQRARVNGMLNILRQWGAVEYFPSINRTADSVILPERIPQAKAVVVDAISFQSRLIFYIRDDGEIVGKRLEQSGVLTQTVIMQFGELS